MSLYPSSNRVAAEQQNSVAFAQSILDALNIIIAVLDTDGTIFAVNEAWRRMARESCPPDRLGRTGIGMNYLQVCRDARGLSIELAPEATAGIEAVLRGTKSSFILEYPCFSPTRQSWYQMNVTPLPQNRGAVVAHIDITERKHLELQQQGQIEKAARIQLQLLPEALPQVNALDIYAHCYQAEQVGGDFYDFFSSITYPFAFIIGDVSGKGLSAALLMAMIHTSLHSVACALPLKDPGGIMARMSENLYDDLTRAGMLVTVFIACYNPLTEHLIYANAGHSPIIHCPNGGPAVLLEADAPVLGIFPTSSCQNHHISLGHNDVLVAGTDGLNESFNATGEMFGYKRLLKTVEALADLPAKQIGTELLKAIAQFTQGYKQSDDQTLVVIKRLAS